MDSSFVIVSGGIRQNPLFHDVPFFIEFHCDLAVAPSTMHQDVLCSGRVVHQIGMIRNMGPTLGGINGHNCFAKKRTRTPFYTENMPSRCPVGNRQRSDSSAIAETPGSQGVSSTGS